jgi:hypothetical protein
MRTEPFVRNPVKSRIYRWIEDLDAKEDAVALRGSRNRLE